MEEEGALAGVWLRKGIGPVCKATPRPCLTATFLSVSALTCCQVGELHPEPLRSPWLSQALGMGVGVWPNPTR